VVSTDEPMTEPVLVELRRNPAVRSAMEFRQTIAKAAP
jgi:hypothetical protein